MADFLPSIKNWLSWPHWGVCARFLSSLLSIVRGKCKVAQYTAFPQEPAKRSSDSIQSTRSESEPDLEARPYMRMKTKTSDGRPLEIEFY